MPDTEEFVFVMT